jgi:hypothetical protein
MSSDDLPTQNHGAVITDCEASLQLSAWARDAGDRAICLVFAAAVCVAVVLGATWLWVMPSFR